MKKTPIESLPKRFSEIVDDARQERVILTKNGRPVAMVVGIENKDWEDLFYESSPEFWKMIEERRKEKGGVPLDVVETKLREREAKHHRSAKHARRRKTAS